MYISHRVTNQWSDDTVTRNIYDIDASCLIDIRRGDLLVGLCNLSHCLIVPLPIREFEVLDISGPQWQQLDDAGMVTRELAPDEMGQALEVMEHLPG